MVTKKRGEGSRRGSTGSQGRSAGQGRNKKEMSGKERKSENGMGKGRREEGFGRKESIKGFDEEEEGSLRAGGRGIEDFGFEKESHREWEKPGKYSQTIEPDDEFGEREAKEKDFPTPRYGNVGRPSSDQRRPRHTK